MYALKTRSPHFSSFSAPTRPLDIPFTFCPGLPLMASGQFEHLSLLALFIIGAKTRLARAVSFVVVVSRSTTFTDHYSSTSSLSSSSSSQRPGYPRVTASRACTRADPNHHHHHTRGTHMHLLTQAHMREPRVCSPRPPAGYIKQASAPERVAGF